MDWNNDGMQDLVVGDSIGKIKVYLNANTKEAPMFDSGAFIQMNETDLIVGTRAAPDVVDWNSDGKKDLIVGQMDGKVVVFINEGTDTNPLFSSSFPVQLADDVLDVGTRSAPRVYDWNRDGLFDLLIGEFEGFIYFTENVGTPESPLFRKIAPLFLYNGEILRYPHPKGYSHSRLSVADWNNDGHEDIVVGGSDGRVFLYLASPDRSSSLSSNLNRVKNGMYLRFSKEKEAVLEQLRKIKKIIRSSLQGNSD